MTYSPAKMAEAVADAMRAVGEKYDLPAGDALETFALAFKEALFPSKK